MGAYKYSTQGVGAMREANFGVKRVYGCMLYKRILGKPINQKIESLTNYFAQAIFQEVFTYI